MDNDLIDSVQEKSRQLVERATLFNETLFEQFTKATELQVLVFRRYADAAVEHARKVSEIQDLEDYKAFSQEQAESFKAMSEQFSDDWEAWQEYFNTTRQQLHDILELENR